MSSSNAVLSIKNNLINIELHENDSINENYNITDNDNNIVNNTIVKKSTYTPAHFRAQTKYREKYPEKYKELQKKYYETYKLDDEWRNNFNAKARENNKKCRERKKLEKIENGEELRGRGRPKKISISVETPIEMQSN
jgi:hypothetical protein